MSEPGQLPDVVTANVSLSGGDWKLDLQVNVVTAPMRPTELLPLAYALTEAVVDQSIKTEAAAGRGISCGPGCAQCCRLAVPIAQHEARHIAAVVDQLPEPRQSVIRGRFADAIRRADEAGLGETIRRSDSLTTEELHSLTRDYFVAQIPCPFLDDESCSIYEQRPATCREYVVTTPAENCAKVTDREVNPVRIALPMFNALARWRVPPGDHHEERWVMLTHALEWVAAHPEEEPPSPGHELLGDLLNSVAGRRKAEARPNAGD
ncbi:MAG: YkgJ family cysteine cluster protein [Gemmataceae bacterium]|nr:YkgJ family cysteine cluster protein [Gemmataceae bacterium]